jgi:hypothetical protein
LDKGTTHIDIFSGVISLVASSVQAMTPGASPSSGTQTTNLGVAGGWHSKGAEYPCVQIPGQAWQ